MSRRFLCAPENISGSLVSFSGAEARHIALVLRLRPGARIIALAPAASHECVIREASPDKVVAHIERTVETIRDGVPEITLAQAIPKGRKMDDIIRMACELGAARIVPLNARRCSVKLDVTGAKAKRERWQAVADAAAKQSRAPWPAEVMEPMDIGSLARIGAELKLALWESASAPLKPLLSNTPRPASVIIVIGPEGGFDTDEANLLKDNGYHLVSLGERIMRTQTAGVVAIGVLLYQYS